MIVRGKVYMLRGGNILRCHGPYANEGPNLAFARITDALTTVPSGYSASLDDVLYELTRAHVEMLESRRAQALARGLAEDVDAMTALIAELDSK
jgi:hypothetical protein